MTDTTAVENGVTSQYVARVADDLEDNRKEQERLGAEIAALQSQLASLDKDREVLLSLQKTLGAAPVPAAPEADGAPSPTATGATAAVDGQTTVTPAKGRKARAKKSVPAPRKAEGAAKKASAKTAAPQQPSLVSLTHEFLAGQKEPRSAAEVAEALAQQHPDRGIKATVVRTTLEGLVAKNRAQRSKQGSSVFYTAPDPTT
ncbi:hypothetical protein OIE43_01265 [Streptomyces pseudovenezuelae]|uniref:hypothetical protein n=1 Tax=Streptomyces pseudovenezuelae TaxID=67350 RepID=UPI002E36B1A4|nr:hypothetical protein [Streptomyces pseudovenezuelae]